MTKDKNPLPPILIRFKQKLQFNGLKVRSQQSYCRAVRKFSEYLKREPDTASEDDLRNYLLYRLGLLGEIAAEVWGKWLSMLVTVTLNMVYVLTVTAKPLTVKPTLKCPECGGELALLGFVPSAPRRQRSLTRVSDRRPGGSLLPRVTCCLELRHDLAETGNLNDAKLVLRGRAVPMA